MSGGNWYVSSEGWRAVAQWAPSTSYSLGQYVRQLYPLVYPAWSGQGPSSANDVCTANFGGTSFAAAAPTGFSAWSATATWDPSHVAANIALSSGNLVATNSAHNAFASVLGTVGKATGKWYFEVTLTNLVNGSSQCVGLAQQGFTLTQQLGTYSPFNNFGYQTNGNFVNITSGQGAAANGNVVGIAYDADLGVVWTRTIVSGVAGHWNNDPTADPHLGQGGCGIQNFMLSTTSGGPGWGGERVFKCTTAGTSGSTQPTWSTSDGGTTTDNTAHWTEVSGREAEQAAGSWNAPSPSLQALINKGVSPTRIFVSQDHNETGNYNSGLTYTNLAETYCVSRTGATLPPTDTDKATTGRVNGRGISISTPYMYGLGFYCGIGGNDATNLNITTNSFNTTLEAITLFQEAGGSITIGSAGGWIRIKNPVLIDGNTKAFLVNGSHRIYLEGVLSTSFIGWTGVFASGNGTNYVRSRGCDFSGATSIYARGSFNGNGANGLMEFFDCKLPTGEPFLNGAGSGGLSSVNDVRFWNCENGGNTTVKFYQATGMGSCQSKVDRGRVNGAFDGVDNFCWQFQKDGSSLDGYLSPFKAPAISNYWSGTMGSSKTITVYVACTTTLDNKQVWLESETLEDSGDTLGQFHTTGVGSNMDTGTTLTTDTSDWTENAASRANSHAYNVGDAIKLASNAGRLFICTTAGTTAGSEPGGYATAVDGGTVTDNSAIFTAVVRYKITQTFTPGRQGLVRGFMNMATTGAQATTFLLIDPVLNIA